LGGLAVRGFDELVIELDDIKAGDVIEVVGQGDAEDGVKLVLVFMAEPHVAVPKCYVRPWHELSFLAERPQFLPDSKGRAL